jgi:hypothetical protein
MTGYVDGFKFTTTARSARSVIAGFKVVAPDSDIFRDRYLCALCVCRGEKSGLSTARDAAVIPLSGQRLLVSQSPTLDSERRSLEAPAGDHDNPHCRA